MLILHADGADKSQASSSRYLLLVVTVVVVVTTVTSFTVVPDPSRSDSVC